MSRKCIIDVGSAEGYYAVGLAMRCPNSQIFTFEAEPYYRHLSRRLARENRIAENLDIRGACNPKTLHDVTADLDE